MPKFSPEYFYADKLRNLLRVSGFTLRKMEELTGTSNAYYSQMLGCKRPITTKSWVKVMAALGLPPDRIERQLAKWKIEEAQEMLKSLDC